MKAVSTRLDIQILQIKSTLILMGSSGSISGDDDGAETGCWLEEEDDGDDDDDEDDEDDGDDEDEDDDGDDDGDDEEDDDGDDDFDFDDDFDDELNDDFDGDFVNRSGLGINPASVDSDDMTPSFDLRMSEFSDFSGSISGGELTISTSRSDAISSRK